MADGEFSTAKALWAIRDDRTLSASEQRVLVMLVAFANEKGEAFPSVRTLAEAARTSPGAVRRALRKLESGLGPIPVQVERGLTRFGDPDANRYTLGTPRGWDHPDPTPDHTDPRVGSPVPQGWDHPDPRGGITGAPEEDLKKRILEEDTEETFELWARALWLKVHKRPAKKTAKRLKPIRARLAEGRPKAELATVIQKVAQSSFHIEGGYIEPETIFKNAEKVDWWLARKVDGGGPRGAPPPQPNHGVLREEDYT